MRVDELRKFTRDGFRPFRISLSDGRTFDVPHPESIAFSDLTVLVIGPDRLGEIIDPEHIVSAKPLPQKSKSSR